MDAAKAAWIMKRREIAQRVENGNHTIIDAHCKIELIAAMNNAMTDGFDGSQLWMRARPGDQFLVAAS